MGFVMFPHMGPVIDLGEAFDDLAKDQSTWSQKTFGTDSDRGPIGALLHLEKRAREAVDAVSSGGFEEEMADCFLLVIDAAGRGGMSPLELVKAAQGKMVMNKQRQWPVPVADVPVEHIH